MTAKSPFGNPGHRFRRLGLPRPPCGAGAGQRGYRIRVAVRRPDLAVHLQPLGRVGQIHAVQANLRYAGLGRGAPCAAPTCVINLVGILFERGRQRFDAVQAYGAEQVALAAQRAWRAAWSMCRRSAPTRTRRRTTRAPRRRASGWCSRRMPRRDDLAAVDRVRAGGRFLQPLRRDGAHSPALPLIGGGETQFQPVFVGDVAEAIAQRGRRHAKAGTIYELGGPEVRTFKELMRVRAGDHRAPAAAGAGAVRARQDARRRSCNIMPKPLLTPDQVELLRSDNVVSRRRQGEGRTLAGARHRAGRRSRRSCRPISGASARPGSSTAGSRGPEKWDPFSDQITR